MEMILKVAAKGFLFNKFSYLRNGWNVLDFTVVLIAYLTEIQEAIGTTRLTKGQEIEIFQILRTFRVLRAMKTISILPGISTFKSQSEK